MRVAEARARVAVERAWAAEEMALVAVAMVREAVERVQVAVVREMAAAVEVERVMAVKVVAALMVAWAELLALLALMMFALPVAAFVCRVADVLLDTAVLALRLLFARSLVVGLAS